MTAAAASSFRESTKPLLRPPQVKQLSEERERLRRMLSAPEYVSSQIQDKKAAVRQARQLDSMLEEQSPKPYVGKELDAAIVREQELMDLIVTGMPTAAEMRRNPPGAVDKHLLWSKTKKNAVIEWKNIRLRRHATGALPAFDEGSSDVSNIESLRPVGGAQEMNLDAAGTQIGGKGFHNLGPQNVGTVVMTDADLATLRTIDPELADMISTMPHEHRQKVRDFVRAYASAVNDKATVTTTEDAVSGTVIAASQHDTTSNVSLE